MLRLWLLCLTTPQDSCLDNYFWLKIKVFREVWVLWLWFWKHGPLWPGITNQLWFDQGARDDFIFENVSTFLWLYLWGNTILWIFWGRCRESKLTTDLWYLFVGLFVQKWSHVILLPLIVRRNINWWRQVTAPTAIFKGDADDLADVEDINRLVIVINLKVIVITVIKCHHHHHKYHHDQNL